MKKNTLNLVAQEQKELVASLPVLTVDDNSLPEFRTTVLGMIKALFPAEKIYGERVAFQGKDTELSVLVYKPEDYQPGEELPGIYYVHGGGYVLGTADMYD